MAANTFATMLHKSSPKMGVLLVYTLLEWVLIGLLLLNALFSYLIRRFADYFGLKPPCLLCSRVDHLFEPGGTPRKSYTDLLCNDHVAEISRLGFCSRHQKVPEGSGGFCSECCSECGSESPLAAEEELKCCCCGAPLDLEIPDDSVRTDEVCGDSLYNQITVAFRGEEGGDPEIRDGAVLIILDEDEEAADDRKDHDEEKVDHMVMEGQGEGDVDAAGEGDVDAPLEREADDVVSVAPSHSSEQYHRVYGADFYVKLLRHCKECGTIMEETMVSEAPLDQNAIGGENLRRLDAQGEDELSPKENLPGPSWVGKATVSQKEALDSSLVFPQKKESGVAPVDCSLVTTADIFFDNQVLPWQKSSSPEEAHLINVDSIATNDDTVVAKEIHIAAASEDFDHIGYETKLKRVSVSDGISEQKPVQVVHGLDDLTQTTGIYIETEDNIQDNEEDDETDGDVSTRTDAPEDHIYSIQNPELFRPLLDHISDDNGKADSERSCEVSIGSEICEQEQPVSLQVQESHSSLADQQEIELKHAIEEGDEGTERTGKTDNVDSQEGSFKEIPNHERSYSQNQDGFPPLSSPPIPSTGSVPEKAVISEESSKDDTKDVSEMQIDHQHCHCELIPSSNASILESTVLEVQEHKKEIHHAHPPLAIQISPSAEVNNGSEINDQTETAKVITAGDSRMLSGHDMQNKEVGLERGMGRENQGDEVTFDESDNIKTETSETSVDNQLNDGQMVDSCKHPEGSKESAEEIPSQKGYTRIDIGSSAHKFETSRAMDQVDNHHQHAHLEDDEMEEEKAPETPNSEEGIHILHTRLAFDKRDHATESVDGSVASEVDGSEPLTVEHLKVALKAERKALRTVYAELEAERSASAISANQTMAMITRLQEEKASMQMEALQYQRMMEEQTEYDQEALQMLNELVKKREKEKLELEQELDKCLKKLEHYEDGKSNAKAAKGQNGFNSGISEGDDSDEHSYTSDEEDQDIYEDHRKHKTSADVILHSSLDQDTLNNLLSIDESLDYFEEERRSILMQLTVLEEKLYATDDDVGSSRKRKHTDESADEHADTLDGTDEMPNNMGTGFSSVFDDQINSEKTPRRKRHLLSGGKRLHPLFDAAASDDIEESQQEQPESAEGSLASEYKSDMKTNKVVVAEKMDSVYERLAALEADREFLKNCIRSLKNGEKGIVLLQEILQHLHDLKHAEVQLKNSDAASGPSSDLNL